MIICKASNDWNHTCTQKLHYNLIKRSVIKEVQMECNWGLCSESYFFIAIGLFFSSLLLQIGCSAGPAVSSNSAAFLY